MAVDKIPDEFLCWSCQLKDTRLAAQGDSEGEATYASLLAKLARLALKRRCMAIYYDFESVMPHSEVAHMLSQFIRPFIGGG